MLARLETLGWIGWLICAGGAVLLAVLANLYTLLARPSDSRDAPHILAAPARKCYT